MVPSLATVPDVSLTDIDGVGNGNTVILELVAAVQPLTLVTVTEYVPAVPVVIPAVVAPLLQTYVPPPLAVSVAIAP